MNLKIMIVAGEASGDSHGAALVRSLREEAHGMELSTFGAAGPKMRAEGVEPIVMSDELSVVGVAEIAGALPMFLRAFNSLKRAADERRPDVVVLIDFPEFNLKLAKSMKKQGFRVVYYISPQIWAWRKYRIRTVRRHVDLMLTILPFEQEWYARQGVDNVEYVGSPLAFEVHPSVSKAEFCLRHGIDPAKPIISLLPGSRSKEISRIFPVLLETAVEMNKADPDIQFVVALANGRHREFVAAALNGISGAGGNVTRSITVVESETYDALAASDAAAVTSGTATLETGIIGTPLAIVYRSSALNYVLVKPLISVEHYGLINLIAGERIAKELIQNDLTAAALSAELCRLLQPEVNARMRADLHSAAEKLGEGGASERAARAILDVVCNI